MQKAALIRRGMAVLGASALTLVLPLTASAHVTQSAGTYKLTFGWQHEPLYAGSPNAVQVFVHDAKGQAVTGISSDTFSVVVSFNGVKDGSLPLKEAFDADTGLGTPGEYDASLIPTSAGDYTFDISGKINGQDVNVSATSSDSTFDSVKDPTEVQFPARDPSAAQLAQRVNQVGADAVTAQNDANRANTVALVAIIVAVVLTGIAVVVNMSARRRPAT